MNCLEVGFDGGGSNGIIALLLCKENSSLIFEQIYAIPFLMQTIQTHWMDICKINQDFVLFLIKKKSLFLKNALNWIPILHLQDELWEMLEPNENPTHWQLLLVDFIKSNAYSMTRIELIMGSFTHHFPTPLIVFLKRLHFTNQTWFNVFMEEDTIYLNEFMPEQALYFYVIHYLNTLDEETKMGIGEARYLKRVEGSSHSQYESGLGYSEEEEEEGL